MIDSKTEYPDWPNGKYCVCKGVPVKCCPRNFSTPCASCDGSVFGRVYCVWAGEECTACPQHREKPCQFCDGTPWQDIMSIQLTVPDCGCGCKAILFCNEDHPTGYIVEIECQGNPVEHKVSVSNASYDEAISMARRLWKYGSGRT